MTSIGGAPAKGGGKDDGGKKTPPKKSRRSDAEEVARLPAEMADRRRRARVVRWFNADQLVVSRGDRRSPQGPEATGDLGRPFRP